MFRLTFPLRFPRLDFVRDVEFSGSGGRTGSKTIALYKLNWSEFDHYQEEKWKEWKTKSWPDSDITYSYKFPGEYEDMLHNLTFAIPKAYLTEIRRMTQQAVIEWGMERGFDTVIREMCLRPAIKFVECAFKLIEDCLYDPVTNYYSRGPERRIISSLMLYRFWQHQTGRGLVEDRAEFDILENLSQRVLDKDGVTGWGEEGVKLSEAITKYLKTFREYYKSLDKAYSIPNHKETKEETIKFGTDEPAQTPA
jgi:hypothetical protein